ncbi:hypothetical protein H5407_22700 [Mitsuaria sp. WAJ17]|uniref:hypothetical protein n=1 Tax=Mitsuaria sp. WAJ17 TaxID=2761452 RepID=UPI0015FF76BB|nr:hypothetical protein [Mitsuaria sp. WAJ17]MBB2488056.1 hypothetical protein [Mitsuaria sp. WAJ17]
MIDFSSDPPNRDDWGDVEMDQDMIHAWSIYGGKKLKELVSLPGFDFEIRCVDLFDMPDSVFCYYAEEFLNYLVHDESESNDFGLKVAAYLDVMEIKRESAPDLCIVFWRRLLLLLDKVAEKVERSEMDADLKAMLSAQLSKIKALG